MCNYALGRYAEAKADFERSFQSLRSNVVIDYFQVGFAHRLYSCEVQYNLGLCLLALGDIDGANMRFSTARQQKPVLDRPAEYYQDIDRALILGPVKALEKLDPMGVPLKCLFRPPGKGVQPSSVLPPRNKSAPTFPVLVRVGQQEQSYADQRSEKGDSNDERPSRRGSILDAPAPKPDHGIEQPHESTSQLQPTQSKPVMVVDLQSDEGPSFDSPNLQTAPTTSEDQLPANGLAAALRARAKTLKKTKSAMEASSNEEKVSVPVRPSTSEASAKFATADPSTQGVEPTVASTTAYKSHSPDKSSKPAAAPATSFAEQLKAKMEQRASSARFQQHPPLLMNTVTKQQGPQPVAGQDVRQVVNEVLHKDAIDRNPAARESVSYSSSASLGRPVSNNPAEEAKRDIVLPKEERRSSVVEPTDKDKSDTRVSVRTPSFSSERSDSSPSSATSASKLRVKLHYHDEIRFILVELDTTFEELMDKVSRKCNVASNNALRVKFRDPGCPEDLIFLTDAEDIEIWLDCSFGLGGRASDLYVFDT